MHYRWPILTCAGLVALGNEFVNSQLAVVVQRLTGTASECRDGSDKCLTISILEYNVLFTIQTIASALAGIFAGYLADRLGTIRLTYISSTFSPFGQILVAMSPYISRNYQLTVMVLGQVFLGFADGALITLAHRVKSSWFGFHELGMSFAIHTVMVKAGAALVFLVYGGLVPSLGLTGCLWLGLMVAVIVCVSTIGMGYLDNQHPALETWRSDAPEGGLIYETKLIWSLVKRQPASLWMLMVAIFFFSGTVITFNVNITSMLAERYAFSESQASYIAGIAYYVQFTAPFVGWLTDRYGRRDYLLLAATAFLVTGITSAFSQNMPAALYTTFIGLGDACWIIGSASCISIIAGTGSAGVAFGLMKLFDSLGQAVWTAAAGGLLLIDTGIDDPLPQLWDKFLELLTGTALAAMVISLALVVFNQLKGRGLSLSQHERRAASAMGLPDSSLSARPERSSELIPLLAGDSYKTFPSQPELMALERMLEP